MKPLYNYGEWLDHFYNDIKFDISNENKNPSNMNDKKYYTDDQRRRYAIDLLQYTWAQIADLKSLVNDPLDQITKYRYLAWSEIDQYYYQTSTIEDEGLTLVSYDEFLRINRLKK